MPLQLRVENTLAPPPPRPTLREPPRGARYEEMFLEVDLNRQGVDKSILVLRRNDGMFLLRLDDLAAFRLKAPSTAPYMHDGTPYFPVDTLPGARFVFDDVHQKLLVTAGPDAFEPTLESVPGSKAYAKAVPPSTGGFFNYDVNAVHGAGANFAAGTFEAGVFGPYGVLLNDVAATHDADRTHAVRLDSTFSRDFPAGHTTLRVGDAITRPGAWGSAIRFGGMQFATNFTTEPGLLTFPTQAVRGQAVVPSLVDVYVNNALVATRPVEPGPFAISNIPFTSGSGAVRLVVRDVNNREQAVTVLQPFYSSNTLLKRGLADYSAEVGKVREDFGFESFSYGEGFGAATYRRGISDQLTGEVRAESSRTQHAAGISATALHSTLGQFDATLAASRSEALSGHLAGLGMQRQATPFTFGGQALWASPGFRRLGQLAGEPPPRVQAAVNAGFQGGGFGSFNVGYVIQDFRDRPRIAIASFGYALGLGHWAQLNVSALRTFGEENGYAVAAGVTVPLGNNMSASAQLETTGSGDERSRQLSTSFQRNRSADSPYSYRASTRGSDVEGIVDYRGNRAEVQLDVVRLPSGVVSRAEVAGGVGYVAGYPFLSRRITASFGVVQVADYADVGILFDNQLVGRTNEKGFFVIPELRAYDKNPIAVRESDLPLDATVGSLKLDASPYYRSGILIDFPVRHIRAGVLYLQLEDGSPLPSGALAHLEGSTEEFPTALRGEVYLTGFAASNRIVATWKGQSCAIDVVYPDTRDPLPDLGKHVCKGVHP